VSEAVVVGAGPNGLTCAAVLARAGVRVTVIEAEQTIGGGTRTSELTVPGVLHDHCSAVHPMAAESPAFTSLDLAAQGLEWCWPEVDLAHPLDDGSAAVMVRSIDATAAGLGADGRAWKRLFGRSAAGFRELNDDDLTRPVVHVPRHPLRLARFGLPAAAPATLVARAFKTSAGRALFGGVAAHLIAPLSRPFSSAVGMALICAGHHGGWPVARGGSRAITDALAAVITAGGGVIETGRAVSDLGELPRSDAVVLDLAPSGVADVAGDRLPARVRRAYRRYRHGPGAFKMDVAVEGGIPWTAEACRRAGTVHLTGSFEETVAGEREVSRGRMPERPYVLLAQQYLADSQRSAGDVHPVWAYAHVPAGYDGDATEALLGQIERFAPGFRERVVGQAVRRTTEFPAYNRNYVDGDIITGANTPVQMVFRPRVTLSPYRTGVPGVYICSAATPPGAGVHGSNGLNAARAVLRDLEGR
jgi:phytoene dehydrogenase-like protein